MGSKCLQLGIFVSLKPLPRKTPIFLTVGNNQSRESCSAESREQTLGATTSYSELLP